MSRAGAEWVRAPMLMRSTPVSARARTLARVTPPEASSRIFGALSLRQRTASRSWSGAGSSSRAAAASWAAGSAVKLAGSAGWGYIDVSDEQHFVGAYEGLVGALMNPGPVQGFCYTQLTDVEQEQNGLAAYDRTPKIDPALIRPSTETPKKGA